MHKTGLHEHLVLLLHRWKDMVTPHCPEEVVGSYQCYQVWCRYWHGGNKVLHPPVSWVPMSDSTWKSTHPPPGLLTMVAGLTYALVWTTGWVIVQISAVGEQCVPPFILVIPSTTFQPSFSPALTLPFSIPVSSQVDNPARITSSPLVPILQYPHPNLVFLLYRQVQPYMQLLIQWWGAVGLARLCSQKGPKHPSPLICEAISHITPSQPPAKPSHIPWGTIYDFCQVPVLVSVTSSDFSCHAQQCSLCWSLSPSSGQDRSGGLPAALAIFITQTHGRTGCWPLYPWLQCTVLWLFISGWVQV